MVAEVIPMRRGRESVVVRQRDNALLEARALRAEMRAARKVIPLARFVRDYVAADGVPLVTSSQGNVVDFLERMARRGGDDAA
jgi:hypothetical protein